MKPLFFLLSIQTNSVEGRSSIMKLFSLKSCKVLILVQVLLLATTLFATENEGRVALIIGNSNYEKVTHLRNPVNDAEDLSVALKKLGFIVNTRLNARKKEMAESLRTFGEALRRNKVGLFYFAGHGVQYEGKNYLLAVDSDIEKDIDIPFEAIDLNRVLAEMEQSGAEVNIVIIDACRNNPFTGKFRSVDRGLSIVKAPKGTLVVYATAPGEVALDGSGRNGVFTEAFLKYLEAPGVDIEMVLKDVRKEVQMATNGKQVPWANSSLTSVFYLNPKGAKAESGLEGSVSTRTSAYTPVVEYGALALAGLPEDVKVFLDGVDVSDRLLKTQEGNYLLNRVPKGQRKVSFEGPYIRKKEEMVTISANTIEAIKPNLELVGKVKIQIENVGMSSHPKATISIQNNKENIKTEFNVSEGLFLSLSPGIYNYSLSYVDDTSVGYQGMIEIEGRKEKVLPVRLDYSNEYKVEFYKKRQKEVQNQLNKVKATRTDRTILSGILLGFGILGSMLTYNMYKSAETSMDVYRFVNTSEQAQKYREEVIDNTTGMGAFALGSGLCLSSGIYLFLTRPNPEPLEKELMILDQNIRKLSAQTVSNQ